MKLPPLLKGILNVTVYDKQKNTLCQLKIPRSPKEMCKSEKAEWILCLAQGKLSVLCEANFTCRKVHFVQIPQEAGLHEIVRCTVKSSLCSDEIFSLWLQMKLNPPIRRRDGFHPHRGFHRRRGFHPPARVDLVENGRFLSESAVFWCR